MEDPSPRVWEGLQKSLEREGLVKSAPARRSLLGLPRGDWQWFASGAVIALLLAGIFMTRNTAPAERTGSPQVAALTDSDLTSAEDQEILNQVAQLSPDLRATYTQGLHDVNSYIADAERSVKENPDDDAARQLLLYAYQQKALLYRMAARSSQ